MENIAGWAAPVATMLAAMITAANLGARVTGWGFVVFLVGSISWVIVAATTGQPNLLYSNLFLTVVNVVGIWRWLGRQAKLEDGARIATERSATGPAPSLFSAGLLQDQPLLDGQGAAIGRVAGTMMECDSGRIAYLVIGEGGVGGISERLHVLPWKDVDAAGGSLISRLQADALRALPEVTADQWPESARAVHG